MLNVEIRTNLMRVSQRSAGQTDGIVIAVVIGEVAALGEKSDSIFKGEVLILKLSISEFSSRLRILVCRLCSNKKV